MAKHINLTLQSCQSCPFAAQTLRQGLHNGDYHCTKQFDDAPNFQGKFRTLGSQYTYYEQIPDWCPLPEAAEPIELKLGNSIICLNFYQTSDERRGWSFSISGTDPDIHFSEHFGFPSQDEATLTAIQMIERLSIIAIRKRQQELETLQDLLQKSQSAQPPLGAGNVQVLQNSIQPAPRTPFITDVTPKSHPAVWNVLRCPE